MPKKEITQLERDLAGVLNRHCQENASNTPDFLLAQFLLGCLAAWNKTTQLREKWYGASFHINGDGGGNIRRKWSKNNYGHRS